MKKRKVRYVERGLFDTVEISIDRSNQLLEEARKRQFNLESQKMSKQEKSLVQRARKWMKKLRIDPNEKYNLTRKTLKELVVDIFYLELSAFTVFSELSSMLAAEGADVQAFDTRLIEKHLDKFKEVYFVYYLYHELGMGHLVDDVLQSIIYGERKDKTGDLINAFKSMARATKSHIEQSRPEVKKEESNVKKKKDKLTFKDLHEKLTENSNGTENIQGESV